MLEGLGRNGLTLIVAEEVVDVPELFCHLGEFAVGVVPPLTLEKLLDGFGVETVFYHTGGDSDGDGIGWHVAGDNGSGTYYGSVANDNSVEDEHVGTDVDIVADCGVLGFGELGFGREGDTVLQGGRVEHGVGGDACCGMQSLTAAQIGSDGAELADSGIGNEGVAGEVGIVAHCDMVQDKWGVELGVAAEGAVRLLGANKRISRGFAPRDDRTVKQATKEFLNTVFYFLVRHVP